MKLSEHFSLSEFERSATATRLGIDNSVPESLIPNLRRLCTEVLEPLREFINSSTPYIEGEERVLLISSGYRCPALNKAVGGAKRSYHLQGRAADIPYRRNWYLYIRDHLPHTELINEGTWIHVAL